MHMPHDYQHDVNNTFWFTAIYYNLVLIIVYVIHMYIWSFLVKIEIKIVCLFVCISCTYHMQRSKVRILFCKFCSRTTISFISLKASFRRHNNSMSVGNIKRYIHSLALNVEVEPLRTYEMWIVTYKYRIRKSSFYTNFLAHKAC